MSRVVIVDYDPSWPSAFEEIRTRVWPAVAGMAHRVEHVGSTSVPGLAAKPVIDVDVVASEERMPDVIGELERLGYEHRGDLGIPGREAFRAPRDLPRHHLYLCVDGSVALANHLAFRDALRASPAEAQAYGALKKRLAEKFADDIDGYIEAKTEFILRVLQQQGFEADALKDIDERNQRPES